MLLQICLVKPDWSGVRLSVRFIVNSGEKDNNSVDEQGSVARNSSRVLCVPAVRCPVQRDISVYDALRVWDFFFCIGPLVVFCCWIISGNTVEWIQVEAHSIGVFPMHVKWIFGGWPNGVSAIENVLPGISRRKQFWYWPVFLLSEIKQILLWCFDPINIFFYDGHTCHFSGWLER